MGVSYFHMGMKIYYTDRTQTKFNYRFLFYIRFQNTNKTESQKRKKKNYAQKKHEATVKHVREDIGPKQQTLSLAAVFAFIVMLFAKPISSHGLFSLLCAVCVLFFLIYPHTNNLHINSVHAASLSWNVFFSFLCL